MRSKGLLICVLGVILFLQGCGTIRGAKEGLKEDWEAVKKADIWMKDHMW